MNQMLRWGARLAPLILALAWAQPSTAQSTFVRGDCNGTPAVNVADAVATVTYLFQGTFDPPCLDACDSNDDGLVDVSDPVYLLQFLFQADAPPPSPYPGCGIDLTEDAIDCEGPLSGCPGAATPTIVSVPVLEATENELYTYDVDAEDADVGNTTNYSFIEAPTGASLDPASGVITWTPTFLQAGPRDFTIRATDSLGLFADQSFTVEVLDVNREPTLVVPSFSDASEGQPFILALEGADLDTDDTLTYTLELAPASAMVDSLSGVVTWIPIETEVGVQDFTVRVTDLAGAFAEESFSVEAFLGGRATLVVTPSGPIFASTFGPGSFALTNTSTTGRQIVRFRLDLRTAIFPDMVFDPIGLAGDTLGKCFTADFGTVDVGLIPPADICVDPFLEPHDGGYDVLEVFFDDFDATESFGFSVDNDPTSLQGAAPTGSTGTGSVSGLELAGSTFEIELDDGTLLFGELYRVPTSLSGSEATAKPILVEAPTLELVDAVSNPTVVGESEQVIRILGTPGADIALLDVEGALDVAGVPGGGFDLNPIEANTAIAVDEFFVTLDAFGVAEVPVSLTRSIPEGGIHALVATSVAADGTKSSLSNRLIVEFNPMAVIETATFEPTADVHVDEAQPTTNLEGADGILVRVYGGVGAQKSLLRFDLTDVGREPGLVASYFDIGTSISSVNQIPWSSTPDFTEIVATVDIPITSGSFWPTGPVDMFASRFKGEIFVPESGDWTFFTTSNDGSILIIDGQPVVDNDGQHGFITASGTTALTAGYHDIEIRHFENTGSSGLLVEFQGPGFPTPTVLPEGLLSHGFPRQNVVSFRLAVTEAACCTAGDQSFEVRQILGAWDPATVTWETRPTPEPIVLGTITVPGIVTEGEELIVELELDGVVLDDTLDLMLVATGSGVTPLALGSLEGPPAARLIFDFFED